MSRYQVDKFLRDINHDRALAERWRTESGAVFDRAADWHFKPCAELRQATVGNAKVLRDCEHGSVPKRAA